MLLKYTQNVYSWFLYLFLGPDGKILVGHTDILDYRISEDLHNIDKQNDNTDYARYVRMISLLESKKLNRVLSSLNEHPFQRIYPTMNSRAIKYDFYNWFAASFCQELSFLSAMNLCQRSFGENGKRDTLTDGFKLENQSRK